MLNITYSFLHYSLYCSGTVALLTQAIGRQLSQTNAHLVDISRSPRARSMARPGTLQAPWSEQASKGRVFHTVSNLEAKQNAHIYIYIYSVITGPTLYTLATGF